MTDLYLVRHGETEWSRTGQHTSITDLPLTDKGRNEAKGLDGWLNADDFGLILASPRTRAQETAKLAGFGNFEVDEDLAEWFYGDYEGMTAQQVHESNPDWQIWTHGVPGGETAEEVCERVGRVAQRVRESGVDKAIVFAHGHALRALTTVWLELPITLGASFPLNTGSLSVLGHYHDRPAVLHWNLARGGSWAS